MSVETILSTEFLGVVAGLITVLAAVIGLRAKMKKPENVQGFQNSQSQSQVTNVFVNPVSSMATASEPSAADKLNTHILFIDDDTSFKVVKILKTGGYANTKIKADIKALDEPDVATAKILFVDIQGVGKALGFSDEGLGLVVALKTRYPDKKVVIYSSEHMGNRFHEAIRLADGAIPKGSDPYAFMSLIEELSRK